LPVASLSDRSCVPVVCQTVRAAGPVVPDPQNGSRTTFCRAPGQFEQGFGEATGFWVG